MSDPMQVFKTELASVRLALAMELAEKGHDYVYEEPVVPTWVETGDGEGAWVWATASSCVYVAPEQDEQGDPAVPMSLLCSSCLWGGVLIRLGVDPEELAKFNDSPIQDIAVPWTSPLITEAAQVSQAAQDQHRPWVDAVAEFETHLRLRGVTDEVFFDTDPALPREGSE